MKYYEIVDKLLNGEKINNIPLRVSYYARVSTDSDVQLNSLDNQLSYYENYIKSNNKWTFINGYVDEGISGTRATKRPAFMRMINDARNNKFDLIITKDVSRFARDIEDSVHYTRMLREYGVGVLFENQSLNTFDQNSELTLNILYNLSQEESKKISTSVKFGFKKAIDNGRVLGSNNITGYRKDNCKLVIVKEEAKFVKKVFELYATGNYGLYKLSRILKEEGYLNKNGNLYDKDSLKRIIENPKYKGYYRAKTYEVLDYRTKKRKKNSINNQIIYKCTNGSIPSIVSEELWNKANDILKSRTKLYKNNYWSGGKKYSFSSKIYCKEHNTTYQRSHGNRSKNRPVWSCSKYLQCGLSSCASPIISEIDLFNIMSIIMNKIIIDKNTIINNLLKLYSNNFNNTYIDELNTINESISLFELKKSNALDLVFNKVLDYNSLVKQFELYDNNIKELTIKKDKLLKQIELLKYSNKDYLKDKIKEELNGGILEDFIREFIIKIVVSIIDNDRHNIKLDIFVDSDLYLENQHYNTVEKNKKNKFIFNVFKW